MDPWWNPAVEEQATDRAYRIGQTRQVDVYKLIVEGSIEEKILQLQEKKATLQRDLYQGDQKREKGLDAETLLTLLREA
jgi:SNF2 family DNA or RNA helicase